ncbi:MAG TPA: hypothetical protein VE978_23960 [Chitinophagales bacterium]|nr:hypothetical protein [Chitinophagales bacterium]
MRAVILLLLFFWTLNSFGQKQLNSTQTISFSKDSVGADTGIVVVKIIVNPNGDVIEAIPGVKGTTVFTEFILQKAKESALKAKFSKGGNKIRADE